MKKPNRMSMVFRCLNRTVTLLVLAGCAHATATSQPAKAHLAKDASAPRVEAHQAAPADVPPTSGAGEGKQGGFGLPAVLQKAGLTKLQDALTKHGFSTKPTPTLDHATQANLRSFQEKEGLARTGMPDQLTLTKLGLDPKEILQMDDAGQKAEPKRE